jgi:hypothetical protein
MQGRVISERGCVRDLLGERARRAGVRCPCAKCSPEQLRLERRSESKRAWPRYGAADGRAAAARNDD